MSALTDVAKQALEYFHDRGCIDTYSEEWGFYLALRDALAQKPKVGEKSLGTENSAGMDALRNAAQRQLDALGGYRREIGLLTGVPDEQPCDAEVAARAALEQQAEPAQEPAGWFEGPFGAFRANQLYKIACPATAQAADGDGDQTTSTKTTGGQR